jgi:hypothetical protein
MSVRQPANLCVTIVIAEAKMLWEGGSRGVFRKLLARPLSWAQPGATASVHAVYMPIEAWRLDA